MPQLFNDLSHCMTRVAVIIDDEDGTAAVGHEACLENSSESIEEPLLSISRE
jgi:hypothetical protein